MFALCPDLAMAAVCCGEVEDVLESGGGSVAVEEEFGWEGGYWGGVECFHY